MYYNVRATRQGVAIRIVGNALLQTDMMDGIEGSPLTKEKSLFE